MNLLQLLQMPWQATQHGLRWLSLVVLALCSGGAVAIGLFADNPDRWVGSMVLYGLGLAYLWAIFFPSSLLVAMDARQLRVPRIQRQIVASLLLYGVLCPALPLVVMGAAGMPLRGAAALLVLCSSGGLAIALLPRYVAAFMGMAPSLMHALWLRLNLPGISDPHFATGAAWIVLALLPALAWRWRQLLRAGPGQPLGWSAPMVLQFRNGSWGHWGNLGDQRQLRLRPAWLQLQPNLDGVGPGAPYMTLRVALGGWYMPQTLRSYIRQLGLVLAIVAVPLACIVALVLLGDRQAHAAEILRGSLIGALSSFSIIAGPMTCLISLQWLRKRWQRANAELPLLALLPGLGGSERVKRQLLRAGLGLPLGLHALLALLAVAAMLYWRSHANLLLFPLLAQVGSAAVTAAAVLNLFGGRALRLWMTGMVLVTTFVLTLLSMLLPVMAWGRHPVVWVAPWLPALGAGWLLLVGAMVWLGRRGWHDLMQRPHPFLTN